MAKKGIYQRYTIIANGGSWNLSVEDTGRTSYARKSDGYYKNISGIRLNSEGFIGVNSTDNSSFVDPFRMYVGQVFHGSTASQYPNFTRREEEQYVVTSKTSSMVYWNVYKISSIFVPYEIRGTYLNDTIADYGSLPADGIYTDGYWYVFVKMASDLKVNVGGIWRDAPTGCANVGGIMRPQSELKANVNGIWR